MENNDSKTQKEMKLLIKIVLYLLLALAFLSIYEVKSYEMEGELPTTNIYILYLFMIGGLILIFAFMTKKSPRGFLYGFTYFWVFWFVIFFFYLFLVLLSNTLGSNKITENLYALIKSEIMWGVLLLVGIIFLLFHISKRISCKFSINP